MKSFFKNRISELRNVTWPTQRQAIHSSIVVLTVMALTGVFLTISDYFMNIGVDKFLNI